MRMAFFPACLLASAAFGVAPVAAAPADPAPAPQQQAAKAPALRAAVSIAPLKGLIEPLLPPGSTVDILVPVGQSEHTAEIDPRRLSALAQADVVITVGRGIDSRIEKVLKDRPPVPPRSRSHVRFANVPGVAHANVMEGAEDHHGHEHDAEGNCIHGDAGNPAVLAAETDPHLWLDPVLCKALVTASADELTGRSGTDESEHTRIVEARDALLARLDELDAEYRNAFAGAAKGRTVIVAHDAWRRPAARYGFETLALAGMHAQEPSGRNIQSAIIMLEKLPENQRVVFAEPQVNRSAIKRVAAGAKARVLGLDPLGDGDYFKMMRTNLEQLRQGLGLPGAAAPDLAAPDARPAIEIEAR